MRSWLVRRWYGGVYWGAWATLTLGWSMRVTGRRKAALLFSEGVDYDLAGLRTRGRAAPVGPTVLAPTLPTGASETDAMGRADVHSYAHDVLLSIQAAIWAAARAHQAERRAHERLAFLAEVSHVLSSSLDHEETLARLGRLSVPRLADCYVVVFVDGGRLVPAGIAHSDPEGLEALEELVRRYPPALDEPHGAGRVARTGEPELVTAVTDETLTADARDDEHLALLRRVGARSSVVVPRS